MITVRIKENHPMAKALVEFLSNFSFVDIEKKKKERTQADLKPSVLKTIEKAEKGIGVNKVKNAQDLFKQLGI